MTEAPEITGVTPVHELERTPPLHSIHLYRVEWSVANPDFARVEACLEWNAALASTVDQAPDSGSDCSAGGDGLSKEFVVYGTFSSCKVKVMVKYEGTGSEPVASDLSEEYSIDLDAQDRAGGRRSGPGWFRARRWDSLGRPDRIPAGSHG